MTGHCCVPGRPSNLPARRSSRIISTILPAALFAVLPKCPLCLAAWLTLATGVGFSAAAAVWLRTGVVLLSLTAFALMLGFHIIRRARFHQ
jgi:hypothetical protein